MNKDLITISYIDKLETDDRSITKVDIFEGALWRRRLLNKKNGEVTVALSSGNSVTVNSRFLGLLRILAEELAQDDPMVH